MASYQDPRIAPKAETRLLRETAQSKAIEPKHTAPKPKPAPKPVFTDWAMI